MLHVTFARRLHFVELKGAESCTHYIVTAHSVATLIGRLASSRHISRWPLKQVNLIASQTIEAVGVLTGLVDHAQQPQCGELERHNSSLLRPARLKTAIIGISHEGSNTKATTASNRTPTKSNLSEEALFAHTPRLV